MSYADILDGLHARMATVSGLTVVKGEPSSIQMSPLLYSVLENTQRTVQGTTVRVTYQTLHRICVRWVDRETAEEELAALVNSVPMAVDASPHLGRETRGQATMRGGNAGWVTIGGIEYRCCDFHSEVLEVGPLGTL